MTTSAPIRLVELFQDGGVSELKRGIRDWYNLDLKPSIKVWAKSADTLEVADVSVLLSLDNKESIKRVSGHGELAVMEDFITSVQPGEVFWDVGANQGSYTLLAAKCGMDAHAFEPGEGAASVLETNLDLNKAEANIHQVALGGKSEEMILAETERMGTRHLIEEGEGDRVKVVRGDQVAAADPDVLKIDVEGNELDVLGGFGDRLNKCRLCYVEVHEQDDLETVKSVLGEKHNFDKIARINASLQTMVRAESDQPQSVSRSHISPV